MRIFAKAAALIRVKGFGGMLRWVGELFWSEREWVVLRKKIEKSDNPGEFEDVIFREATVEDIPLFTSGWPAGFGARFGGQSIEEAIRSRILAGEIVTIGVNRSNPDELVFTSILCHNSFTLWAKFGSEIPPGDVCSSHIWVSDAHRRKAIAARGMKFVETLAYRRGKSCLWALVLPGNEASLKLHDNLGYERYERMWYQWRFAQRFVRFERERRRRRLPVREPKGLFQ